MADRPLVKESLFFLNIVGAHPNKFDPMSILRASLIVLNNSFSLLNLFLECFLHWKGADATEDLSAAFGTYLVLVKLMAILIYHKNFSKLISNMEEFWLTDRYGPELEKEIQTTQRIVRTVLKFMMGTLCILVPVYLVQPLMGSSRQLFVETYFPSDVNKSPQYEIVLVSQFAYIITSCISLLGFDGMLISLIVHITSELKLVKLGFEKVPIDPNIEEETKEELDALHEVIDHHRLILDCIQDIRKVYSGVLLNVYLCNVILICAGLLGVIAAGFPPEPQRLYQYGLYLFFYSMELFFYCITGTYMAGECESVSEAVYNMDWHVKPQVMVRKACFIVILRAQQEENLTAGGLYDINLNSFTTVMNNAFSVFTLMNALYGTDQ